MSAVDPFEGKETITPEYLAEVMRNDLIGRTVADVRITDDTVLIVFDTGQELEFAPDANYGMRFQGIDAN